MRYLIALTLCLSGLAYADTVQQKIDALNALPAVLEAKEVESGSLFNGLFGELYWGRVVWYYVDKGVAKKDSAELIIVSRGTGSEAAYWLNVTPPILVPAVAPTYMTGRTVPFTLAQCQSFANTQWRATSGNSAALDVKEFTATNVDPNTIRVSGLFHDVATNTRPHLTYLITLVDANGATTAPNVKFEKVIEQ